MSKPKEKTIGVTEFKAKCLALVEEVARGKTSRVVLTKRWRAVAELRRPSKSGRQRVPDPWGALRHMMKIDPSVDLTEPSGLEWDAEKGILYNE